MGLKTPDDYFGEVAAIMGPRTAVLWLISPNPELEFRTPTDCIISGDTEAVEGLIHDMRSGQPG